MGQIFKYAPPTGYSAWDPNNGLSFAPKSPNVTLANSQQTGIGNANAPTVSFGGIAGWPGGNIATSITGHSAGLFYAEFLAQSFSGSDNQGVGFCTSIQLYNEYLGFGTNQSVGIYGSGFMGGITVSNAFQGFGTILTGTTIGIAINLNAQTFWYRTDYNPVIPSPSGGPNLWVGSLTHIGPPTDPATGTNGISYASQIPAGSTVYMAMDVELTTQAWTVNFGPPPPPPPPPPAPPVPAPLTPVAAGTQHWWFEVMTPELEPLDGLGNAWFVDAGIVPVFASLGSTGITLIGLWPFNTMNVDVWMCGLDWGQGVVSNGALFMPFDTVGQTLKPYRQMAITPNVLETLSTGITAGSSQAVPTDFASPYIQCVVGFAHASRGQRLRDLEPQSAASGSMVGPALGKTRRVHMASFLFDGIVSNTVSVGTNFNTMYPIITTDLNMSALDATQLYSGVWFDAISGESDKDGQLAWSITRPYPLEIMAVESHLVTQER